MLPPWEHVKSGNMLPITDAQGRILEKFIEYDGKMEGKIKNGLTSGALEKLGISRQTFDKKDKEREMKRGKKIETNKDYLLEHYFIRRNKTEDHGTQIWEYYLITTLGVLEYLKWKASELLKTPATITKTFFPLIIEHLQELQSLYHKDVIGIVLLETAKKIKVQPEVTIRTINTRKIIPTKNLTMEMSLPMGQVDVVLYHDLGEPKIIMKPSKLTKIYDDSQNNKLNQKISEWYTFAFYYNLINLPSDAALMIRSMWQLYPFFKVKDSKIYDVTDIPKYQEKTKRFQRKMSSSTNSVIKIINQDPKLHSLFKKNFVELEDKLQDREIIKLLQTKIK